MIRPPPRSTPLYSSAASDVYKRQVLRNIRRAIPRAPVVIVGLTGLVEGRIAFIPIAEAAITLRFAAAVVIRNDVILTVRRIVASADPSDRGHFRPRWATRLSATATTAQEAIDRTVAPVLTRARIPRITARHSRVRSLALCTARYGQQWQGCCAHQQCAETPEEAAPR